MPENITFIEIIAGIAIGYGMIKGLSNGLIKELAGLIGLIIGVWAGFRFAFIFADYYKANFEMPEALIPTIAFVTAFGLALVAVLFAGKILRFILDKAALSPFDKVAGALFGGLKLAFLVGSLISVIGKAGLFSEEMKARSIAYPILSVYVEAMTEYTVALIPTAKNVFTEMDGYFDGLKEKDQEDPGAPKKEKPEEDSPDKSPTEP